MPHMVIFRSAEGKPGYHQAETLDEAVRFTERLRNQEQVSDARIFRMQEVPIEFKPYYKVEVAGSVADEAPVVRPADDEVVTAVVARAEDDLVVADPSAAVPAGGSPRFGRFNRS